MYQNFGDLGVSVRGTCPPNLSPAPCSSPLPRSASLATFPYSSVPGVGPLPMLDYVNEYQQKTNTNKKLESIEDMKRFMQEMPEFRRLGGNVSKHVSLMAHLSRLVDDEVLLEVSEVEQELAAVEDHSAAIQVRDRAYPSIASSAGSAHLGARAHACGARRCRMCTASWTIPRCRSTTRSASFSSTRFGTSLSAPLV